MKSMSKKQTPKKKPSTTPQVPQSRLKRLMRGPLFWITVAIVAVSVFGQISGAGNRYETIKTSQALDAIAKNHGASLSAVALAWLRSNPAVSAPIASARTVEQLLEIIQIVKLSGEEVEQLNTASR